MASAAGAPDAGAHQKAWGPHTGSPFFRSRLSGSDGGASFLSALASAHSLAAGPSLRQLRTPRAPTRDDLDEEAAGDERLSTAAAGTLGDRIDRLLAPTVAASRAGAAYAVARRGVTIASGAAGVANVALGVPLAINSLTDVASIFCSPPFREPAACMHGRVHVPPPPPPSCATMGGRLARRPDDHPVGTKSGGAVSDVEGGGNGEWRTTTNSRAQNLGWGERKAADQPACPRCASTANIPTILEPTMRQPPGIRRRASRRLTALSPHQHQSVLCQAPPHQHGWPLRRAPYFFPPIESAPR